MALRAALRAIEWPDDELHVYAALRGPFVALHDEQLFCFREQVGRLHPLRPLAPEQAEGHAQVVAALELLRQLHLRRNRRPIADTIAAFLDATRAHAGIAIWPTGEQALANVLRALEEARRFEGRGATSFRSFVDWLEDRADRGEGAQAPVVEEGSEGVRMMSVHRAKGLEFPVVVLCDPGCSREKRRPSRHVDSPRGLWAAPLAGCSPVELLEHQDAGAARRQRRGGARDLRGRHARARPAGGAVLRRRAGVRLGRRAAPGALPGHRRAPRRPSGARLPRLRARLGGQPPARGAAGRRQRRGARLACDRRRPRGVVGSVGAGARAATGGRCATARSARHRRAARPRPRRHGGVRALAGQPQRRPGRGRHPQLRRHHRDPAGRGRRGGRRCRRGRDRRRARRSPARPPLRHPGPRGPGRRAVRRRRAGDRATRRAARAAGRRQPRGERGRGERGRLCARARHHASARRSPTAAGAATASCR